MRLFEYDPKKLPAAIRTRAFCTCKLAYNSTMPQRVNQACICMSVHSEDSADDRWPQQSPSRAIYSVMRVSALGIPIPLVLRVSYAPQICAAMVR